MASEKDIYRLAQATVHKCGRRYDPLDYAFSNVERSYSKGDTEGAATWMRIVNAIGDILSRHHVA